MSKKGEKEVVTGSRRDWWIGYCTNVHAGTDLETAKESLDRYAVAAHQMLAGWQTIGVGLWLPSTAASMARQPEHALAFDRWLRERSIDVRTMNGFPHGNFHQPVVKHRVYEPTWWDEERYRYTIDLVHLLGRLIPEGATGSISTLPISWGNPEPNEAQWGKAADQLKRLAAELAEFRSQTGREVVVCLEPEPGCAIGATAQLRDFFESYLFAGEDQQVVRRHIGWCHDICHAAVMREDQEAEIQACFDMGIRLGKVQVSSALAIHWSRYQADQKEEVLQQLSSFAEDRYLHQTVAETASGARKWYEDLPAALASIDDVEQMEGTWSVHFHVPIHLAGMGILDTTRDQIGRCVEIVRRLQNQQAAAAWDWFTGIWEVETYAWGVLPPRLRPADLSEGIAAELQWFRSVALDNSDFCR